MDFSEITKVVELCSEEDANRYLNAGWKLLEIYKTAYHTEYPGCNHQTPHYILGWTTGTPIYPNDESRF